MDIDRWRRVEALYHAARALPEDARSAFLADSCRGDTELRRELESLLTQLPSAEWALATGGAAVFAADGLQSDLIGRFLGVYQLRSRIGAGGMGEVFRARDTRLGRDVAIKILPPAFTADPERLRRFEREARVLASLNHQNIATIHGVEEADGLHALVLELIEGDTLAERLSRGPLSLKETLAIARQLTDALETAHEQGIVHRDLKPANVKITTHGVVKVLDFGLAKVLLPDEASAETSAWPTVSTAGTREGAILGTAAYMSPEQARGKPVDKRADIWAFGCLLYEMLSGQPTFAGDNLFETLAAVLTREPEWSALPQSTPAGIRLLLGRCLDRDSKMRLRDIGEARVALSDSVFTDRPPWLAAARPRSPGPLRLLELGDTLRADYPAVSPDGSMVAYVKSDGLWVRRLDQPTGSRIVSSAEVESIAWSPSGDALAYFLRSEVRIIRADGTEDRAVWRPARGQDFRPDVGLAWSRSDLYVPARGGILRVPVDGSEATFAARWIAESSVVNYRFPLVFDNGRTILVNPGLFGGKKDFGTVWAFQGGVGRQVLSLPETAINGLSYSAETRDLLIIASDHERFALWAASFDVERITVGAPRLVLDGAVTISLPSADGTLALIGGLRRQTSNLLWLDSQGRQTRRVPHGRLDLRNLALSPDGSLLAVTAAGSEGGAQGLWVYDFNRGLESPAAPDSQHYAWPSWSPDGRLVAFASSHGGKASLYIVRMGEGRPPTRLAQRTLGGFPTWRPDGSSVVFVRLTGTKGATEVAEVAVDGDSPVKRLGQISHLRGNVSLSPDGRRLAYDSGTGGRTDVTVTTFPDLSSRLQVSREAACLPQWSPGGDEIWFLEGNQIVAVRIDHDRDGRLAAGRARTLLTAPSEVMLTWVFCGTIHRQYATLDGKRFLVPGPEHQGEPRVTLVQNLSQLLQPRPPGDERSG